MKQLLRSLIIFGLVLSFVYVLPVTAQITALECGSIVENEFTANAQFQDFEIMLNAGDRLSIRVAPLGDQLSLNLAVFDPTGRNIGMTDFGAVSKSPLLEISTLSASGKYTITVANARYSYSSDVQSRQLQTRTGAQGGIGLYTLFVNCALRDGTIINAGDAPPPAESNAASPQPLPATAFSGTGFPGLPAVDFANIAEFPLDVGVGTITPNNQDVIGFVFDANGGETLNLSVDRLSGNLNLGVVVLSPDNQVVSYGGLITAENFSTRFLLPSPGTYTIGVFQINLLPLDSPEATAFRVTGELGS